jgi:hypothetical protein
MSTIGLTADQALTELRNNPQKYRTAEQLKARPTVCRSIHRAALCISDSVDLPQAKENT